MDEWKRHFPLVDVGSPRFPHPFVAAQVKKVINELEGNSEFHAEAFEGFGFITLQTGDQSRCITTGGKRSGRFSTDDGKVVLGRGGEVENVVQLVVFRNGDVGATTSDDRNDLFGVATTEGKSVDKQPVTGDHRLGLPGLCVDGGYAASLLSLVVNVIVDERSGVDQFKRECQRHDVVQTRASSHLIGQEEEEGAKALSTGVEHPTCLNGNLTCPRFDFGLNQVKKSLIHILSHGFQRGTQRLNIAAHIHPTTVGFLTGRQRPCYVRGDPHRGETMETSERLVILTTPSRNDGVRLQIEQTVSTHGKHRDLLLKQLPHMETALQTLRDGTGDLVAMSAFDWQRYDVEGLSIAGLLPRKEPTWVLVADDKPEYLVQGAHVLCDHELLRRQMKRMRPDLVLESMDVMVARLGAGSEVADLDEEEVWPWVEGRRMAGDIDGFIVPRAIHAGHRMKGRRHTLGLQRDQTEHNRERFIPPPLHGFTLMVGRQGFPKASIKEMLDPSAELAYRLEGTLLESLAPELQPIVGAYVEQRKISTFLKKATEDGDETLLTSLVDPNKKRGVYRSGPRVEMLIETLTPDGTVTAACERIVQPENSHMGMVNLLKEFMELFTVMTTDHEATKRNIRGMPDSFMEPKPRLMNMDE